jgi:3-oxoacyl-[acyl-carrier protein] reductase
MTSWCSGYTCLAQEAHVVDVLQRLFGLSGQVAIVTGGGRGIGRAISVLFAQAGADLTICGRTLEPLEETAREIRSLGRRVLAIQCDVSNSAQVEAMVARTLEEFGRIDVLVNNAGFSQKGQMLETTDVDWAAVLDTNLTGAFYCARAVFPIMQRQRSGCIINIASISGQTGGVSANVNYAASKAGMIGFTKALARQMAAFGGRANAIAPGQITTRLSTLPEERLRYILSITPLGRLGTPEEVAAGALFLASPAASFITGHTLNINGGILME